MMLSFEIIKSDGSVIVIEVGKDQWNLVMSDVLEVKTSGFCFFAKNPSSTRMFGSNNEAEVLDWLRNEAQRTDHQ